MSGTGSLMIRNLRKASDYDKARMNQDELLKIAIANDNNIANARRSYKQGEVPALTPQQQYTPDEIQADLSKNYSDAITNLLSLGMDYREASDIATRLGADPTNLVILNNTFPSIKVDFQKRFDVKRVTATGFVDFFRKFREVFDETKGIADNSTLFNDKFDRIINNINDLRAVVPTKTQITALKQSLKDTMRRGGVGGAGGIDPREIVFIQRQLDAINRKIPDEAFFQHLADLDPQRQFAQLARLQDSIDDLPSRDDIQRIIDRAGAGQASPNDILQAIKAVADSSSVGIPAEAIALEEEPEAIAERQQKASQLSQLAPIPINEDIRIGSRVYDEIGIGVLPGGHPGLVFTSGRGAPGSQSSPLNQSQIGDVLDADANLRAFYARITGQVYRPTNESQKRLAVRLFINSVISAVQSRGGRSLKPAPASSSDWTEEEVSSPFKERVKSRIQEEFRRSQSREPSQARSRSPSPEQGHGIRKGRPQIMIKKIGRGISVPDEPSHIEFGKHLLHYKNLEKGVLSLHHKGGGRVASIPVQKISDDLKDFIVDMLQSNSACGRGGGQVPYKKASQKEFVRLPIHEQKLFEKIANGAGIFHKLGLKPVMDDDDKKNMDRFEVLRGEYMAGNNSHELVRELRKLVIYFMDAGRLTKSQGRELLLNIN